MPCRPVRPCAPAHRPAPLRVVVDNSPDATASKSASVSFTPSSLAASSSGKKCRCGTPRCIHFLKASSVVPIRNAKGRSVFQMSIVAEYRDKSSPRSIPKKTGQNCPSKKARQDPSLGMGRSAPESDFNAVFRLRTKLARENAGLTQAQVAAALQVDVDKYKKWENRPTSAVPRDLMHPFSIVVRCDLSWLLSPPTRQEIAQARPLSRQRA